ncbi:serine hydrolase [Nodosilinea sp. LEGE 07088]|uniref:serine hydrolase n=1 Tax=Nodosilinea sp. LEGE 07088 TaxID=2777968 RepID=UPI00187EE7E9|nr:serine hydrolase [Nodosilinea sp. LEGE 07088]MBE9137348.1 serine hydrolase [Nodosilinea sp. LEGE 07088]
MAQYDDSHNPFSATGRSEDSLSWRESAPAPQGSGGQTGLHLPGETEVDTWRSEGGQRPSPESRRRNQWRQFQQLTSDFGTPAPEPEPAPRPAARNAALPTFKRGPVPTSSRPEATHPDSIGTTSTPPLRLAAPGPRAPGLRASGPAPLQMHPHSMPANALNVSAGAAAGQPHAGGSPNVTPLRRQPRRPQRPSSSSPVAPSAPLPGLEETTPPRRSRLSTAQRRIANPPLPLLYLIRLVIFGVGVAAIAGTLLSVLSPSNVASTRDGETPTPQTAAAPAGGALVQGTAADTVTDLRLTSESSRLVGELEQLATLTPGLTSTAFAVDLDSGQYVDLGGAEPVAAASTIKMPILVAFLQQVDAGNVTLNQAIALREDAIAGGSGTLGTEAVGTEYTALEIATRMIVSSDNTATNLMIGALGGVEALNQTFATWGLEHTVLRNPLPDLEGTNTTSAKDLALILALVDQGGLLTPRSRDRLFSIMQRTENDSLIPSGINDRSLTAHKTGDIGSLLGDVALVDVPNGKRYVLALLVQRPSNDGRASELIRRMTETIHTEMAQPVAPVGNPNAAQPSPTDSADSPYNVEDPDAVEPVDMNLPDRAPARDEIPPG